MKKKILLITLVLLICVGLGFFIYLPKNIDTILKRIEYPFEVGEVLKSYQIEENLTCVLYTNKEKHNELQNVLIRKTGIFYKIIEMNGSLTIEKPNTLESGQLRSNLLISWYDKSDKYVVMGVAYDEDVEKINYLNHELMKLDVNGYRLFYGFGRGEYKVYELFDANGSHLEHIKE